MVSLPTAHSRGRLISKFLDQGFRGSYDCPLPFLTIGHFCSMEAISIALVNYCMVIFFNFYLSIALELKTVVFGPVTIDPIP